MSSHFNVTVPCLHGFEERLIDENTLLKFQKSELEKKLNHIVDQFQNVFHSVKDRGFVELTWEGEMIILIQKPAEAAL